MHISMTRESLLSRLKDRLEAATKDDEKTLARHADEERKFLKKFHDKCRDALLWDYKKLKANEYRVGFGYGSSPTCPTAEAPAIRRAITEVTLDKRKDFTVIPGTNIHEAVNWLPRSERKKEMC